MDTSKVMTTEIDSLKSRLRATWIAGDFGEIARGYRAGAEEFVSRLAIKPGARVLDVACGTGNLSLPAARDGAAVTGLDIAPNLIEQAVQNAKAENLDISFDVGDAEEIPYNDRSFDIVMTMFGAMFAPRPELVVSELKRVGKSGGVIAMANWTPEGFIGQMFKTTGKHVAPPAGMPSPLLWGHEDTVRERLCGGIASVQMNRREVEFRFPFGPTETVAHFRKFYGPTQKAFDALDENGQTNLFCDIETLWTAANIGGESKTHVKSEYLEVIATLS